MERSMHAKYMTGVTPSSSVEGGRSHHKNFLSFSLVPRQRNYYSTFHFQVCKKFIGFTEIKQAFSIQICQGTKWGSMLGTLFFTMSRTSQNCQKVVEMDEPTFHAKKTACLPMQQHAYFTFSTANYTRKNTQATLALQHTESENFTEITSQR